MSRLLTRLSVIMFCLIPLNSAAQTDQEAVLAVAQKVFDGINTKNAELITANMMPEGVLFSTMNGSARFTSASDFASQVEGGDAVYHERMFETTVHVQDGVALVWADYDFHVDGEFSHCGIDTFSLVKTPEGWKVASLTYTVQREGCAPRPPIPDSQKD